MINDRLAQYIRTIVGQPLTREAAADILVLSLPYPNVIDVQSLGSDAAGGVTIQAERILDARTAVDQLFAEAWSAIFPGIPYNGNLDGLVGKERAGSFLFISAKDGERYVGMACLYLTCSEFGSCVVAQEGLVYVKPSYRLSGVATVLGRFAERCARKLGAERMRLTVRAGKELVEVLKREGYSETAIEMTKVFQPGDST